MHRQTLDLVDTALAPETRKAYSRAWDRYCKFAHAFGLPTSLPLKTDHVSCFLTNLYNEGLPASSITSILSALSYFHKIKSIFDPTQAFIIRKQLVAINKQRPSSDKREPMSEELLFSILDRLEKLNFSQFECTLFQAMFLMAFYFGLRVGEITASKHNILLDQIKLHSNSLTLSFGSFKHSNLNPGPPHTISSNGTRFSTVEVLANYLKIRGRAEGPLFLLNNKPVPAALFNSRFKNLVQLVGRNPKHFSSHSFRIGAATFWANKGHSDVQIRRLGRWRSEAMISYLRGSVHHTS